MNDICKDRCLALLLFIIILSFGLGVIWKINELNDRVKVLEIQMVERTP